MDTPKEVSDWMKAMGSKGGKARAANLSPEQRRKQAIKASKAAAKKRSSKKRDR